MQKVIKAIKDCVASKTCCEETGVNCKQGRNCPVREGTHKPAEAVHQIQEPEVSVPDEREAFGIPQCPFPCGWKNLHTLLVAEGAFLARSLQEDEPITEHQRATVMRVVNYGLEMARAALSAAPAAAPVIPSELIEAVDAWFAQNTGLGGCSDKDVAELAAIFAAAAPVTLPEPVPTPCRSMFATQREYADAMVQHRKNWAEIEAERALLATGGQAQAVEQAPVLYVSKGQLDNHRDPDGPDSANAGRYLPCRITPAGKFTTPLFAAPQAQADARDAEGDR